MKSNQKTFHITYRYITKTHYGKAAIFRLLMKAPVKLMWNVKILKINIKTGFMMIIVLKTKELQFYINATKILIRRVTKMFLWHCPHEDIGRSRRLGFFPFFLILILTLYHSWISSSDRKKKKHIKICWSMPYQNDCSGWEFSLLVRLTNRVKLLQPFVKLNE